VTRRRERAGDVVRPVVLGVDLAKPWTTTRPSRRSASRSRYCSGASIAPRSAASSCNRENEQRARFIGYPTDYYKLFAFTASATITALAGTLSMFHHRFASADPVSGVSGELLAMVVIGGMRSFLGPALGALFFILFREFLSIWTPNWLLFFGLLFVGFIVFRRPASSASPRGFMRRSASARSKPRDGRPRDRAGMRHCRPCWPTASADGPVLIARELAKSFGGIRAGGECRYHRARSHAALR